MPIPVKPLGQLTRLAPDNKPKSRGNAQTRPRTSAPHSIDNYEPHSKFQANVSQNYHKNTVTGSARRMDTGASGNSRIQKLNPSSAPASVRRFPGL